MKRNKILMLSSAVFACSLLAGCNGGGKTPDKPSSEVLLGIDVNVHSSIGYPVTYRFSKSDMDVHAHYSTRYYSITDYEVEDLEGGLPHYCDLADFVLGGVSFKVTYKGKSANVSFKVNERQEDKYLRYFDLGEYKCRVSQETKSPRAEIGEYVELPETVDSYYIYSGTGHTGEEYTVTTVAEKAFENNTTLKRVTFNSNIQYISNEAFAGCTALEEIDMTCYKDPNNVPEIMIDVFPSELTPENFKITVANNDMLEAFKAESTWNPYSRFLKVK